MVINIKGRLVEWRRPAVMGIINLTDDSFYAGSRVASEDVTSQARAMIDAGCDILDLGACSTRPGSEPVDPDSEQRLIRDAVSRLRRSLGDGPVISVDTFRAAVAEAGVEAGADIINDISGGDSDSAMFETVAALGVPYVLTHSRGTACDMQGLTDHDDIVAEVLRHLAFKVDRLHSLGVRDVLVDPGFGFAKTLEQNYRLLASLDVLQATGCPILVGISRKSMICKKLGITPEEALNGTTALHMAALMNGADILRVHDVRQAVETVRLFTALQENSPKERRIIEYRSYPRIDKTQ